MRVLFVTAALAFALSSTTLRAEPIRQPLVSPRAALERQLIDDAADERLDSHTLLQASLVASGVHDARKLDAHIARFESTKQQLQREVAQVRTDRDRAATVLGVLHGEFLTGPFEQHCGDITATLDAGRHNCVTATLLFAALAQTIRLPVTILQASGHVRVRIDGEQPFELEPTCAAWFRQSDAKLLPWQAAPRELSTGQLVAKLYYNQGVAALERKQFEEAITALDRSLLLDSADKDAKHNLLAALNNGALQQCTQRDFSAAADLLRSAAQVDPDYAPLATNDLHLLGQWTIACCEAQDFAQALTIVQQAQQRHPSSELARHGSAAVYRLWAEALLRRGEGHAALARVQAGLAIAPQNADLLRLKERIQQQSRL